MKNVTTMLRSPLSREVVCKQQSWAAELTGNLIETALRTVCLRPMLDRLKCLPSHGSFSINITALLRQS